MHRILDHIEKIYSGAFVPTDPGELFALRLASRLGEPQSAAHYALLLSRYGLDYLLAVYRKTVRSARPAEKLGAIFHYELDGSDVAPGRERSGPKLLAIRIERRSLAAAVFSGARLRAIQVRALPTDAGQARDSAAGFIGMMLEDHEPECAVMESAAVREGLRRAEIRGSIRSRLSADSVPVAEIPLAEVLSGFAYPPLPGRADLRKAVSRICPPASFKSDRAAALDAVSLGLYVQTERLLSN